jgi:hypothetical protein
MKVMKIKFNNQYQKSPMIASILGHRKLAKIKDNGMAVKNGK